MICANATCYHKLPLILIEKYNRPACFANQTCPLKYATRKRTMMNIPTISNWFNKEFYPGVRRRTCYPDLLLMDNDPGHFERFQRENVVMHFVELLQPSKNI